MYHQRFPSRYDDPFTDHVNTVNPLQIVGDSSDEYSIKVSILNHRTRKVHVNAYTGRFVSDLNVRAVGFQGAIMDAIESIIQQTLVPEFDVGSLPTLGRPSDYLFNPDDILVSFASQNDYLIFNGTGVDREVTFFTTSQLPQYYRPGDFGAPADFTFTSSENVNNTYKVTYPEYGNFTILVNGTKILTFDNVTNPSIPIATYDSLTLVETVLDDDTKIYKTAFYTSVGITVLPAILPMDQEEIIVAEGQPGLFYTEDILNPKTSQDVIDYIYGLYNFTAAQRDYISKLIKVIFAPIVRSIYHVLNIRNRDSYSVNNGFAAFASFNCVGLEIKLS